MIASKRPQFSKTYLGFKKSVYSRTGDLKITPNSSLAIKKAVLLVNAAKKAGMDSGLAQLVAIHLFRLFNGRVPKTIGNIRLQEEIISAVKDHIYTLNTGKERVSQKA